MLTSCCALAACACNEFLHGAQPSTCLLGLGGFPTYQQGAPEAPPGLSYNVLHLPHLLAVTSLHVYPSVSPSDGTGALVSTHYQGVAAPVLAAGCWTAVL